MNSFFRQLWELIIVQFKEFYREPEILFWALAFPIAMAWVLGIAFSGEAEQKLSAGIVFAQNGNSTHSVFLKQLSQKRKVEVDSNNSKFVIKDSLRKEEIALFSVSVTEAEQMLMKGKIVLYLIERQDSITYCYDPGNNEAKLLQLVLLHYTDTVNNKVSVEQTKIQGTRYIDFFVPGLLALNIMSSVLWAIGYSLIEKRSKKVLRRMVATPMSKTAFLGSIMIGRIVIGTFEAAVLLLFAYLYFGFTIKGSLVAFIILFLTSHICFSGIAILIASRTEKPQFGNALINLVYLPMSICCGVFFSYQGFPSWSIPVIEKLPLTMMSDGFRAICNQGAGIGEIVLPAIVLSITGLLFFVVGLRVYRWY